MGSRSVTDKDALEATWRATWPAALAAWSQYTQLREPTFLITDKVAKPLGMAGEIAAIRLRDQVVMVNLEQVQAMGLTGLALPVLAHEIGHHIYVPGNLADNARMIAIIQPYLFGLPHDTAHLVANLYGDLLINDRLERRAGVLVSDVYRQLKQQAADGPASDVWKVYTRTYEHLWRLAPETLSPAGVSDEMHADAALLARLIRHYAGQWLRGTRRFTCILYPYLLADQERQRTQTFCSLGLSDCRHAGRGAAGEHDSAAIPDGLIAIDPAELDDGADFDRDLDDLLGEEKDLPGPDVRGRPRPRTARAKNTQPEKEPQQHNRGQCREPFAYAELLRALGLNLSDHEITTRYYRERALPHLLPFPVRRQPRASEPLAEGFESWDAGDDLDGLDLFGSLMQSATMIPGVTTVQRVFGETPGTEPARRPLDLDIYVDCSGSMPNPAVSVSYLALAGAILALSALRAGARVQATLWSGAGQFETSRGFIRDEKRILGIVAGYISGGTAFPLHVLRDTYATRKPDDTTAHIVVISDDGADTMLARDERDEDGSAICSRALAAARGGGTLVLNLPDARWPPREIFTALGFKVHAVADWEQLVAFARAFVRENYQ